MLFIKGILNFNPDYLKRLLLQRQAIFLIHLQRNPHRNLND
ncbi:response regulator [Lyngbya aestuarii BL J]|uniref:Response regulator n=1 Tax=Lyngbya aestuarii BL J TaxID=1348334 RepID=U7QIW3_9CYAN|nr:response regulator [Lyngbya aestuarii BL J]